MHGNELRGALRRLADEESWTDPAFVDAIARRLLELQQRAAADADHAGPDLLTVAEVAKRLRVNPKWVYAHQQELGAIRLGEGPRARLRFDSTVVDGRLRQLRGAQADADQSVTPGPPTARRRRRLQSRPLPVIDRAGGPA